MLATHSTATPVAHAPTRRAAEARLSRSGKLFITVMLVLILEGAVRKWVADASTLPLILLRDLLVIYTIVRAVMRGHMRRQRQVSQLLLAWCCLVLGWGLLQLVLGVSNFQILAIGLRFWLLYIVFAFAAAAGMNEYDYNIAIRILMLLLVLMAPLAVLQHESPPNAFVNRASEGDAEDLFLVIEGVVRTTGTFSFTAGFVYFISLCAPFALGALEARKRKPRQRVTALVLFGALMGCAIVSGARTAVVYTAAMLVLYLAGNLVFSPLRRKGFAIVAAVLAALLVAALLYYFQGAVEATQQRFETAAESENPFERVFYALIGEKALWEQFDWLGAGLGIGSNLAQYVQFSGRRLYILAESETGRILAEGGLLGIAFVLLKLAMVIGALSRGFVQSVRTRTVFPLLMWIGVTFALFNWLYVAQLTANGLLGVFLALGLLSLRYPVLRLFERRRELRA